jgi:ribosomal 30S subunit maturation factor RimM
VLGTVAETFETPAHEVLVIREEGDEDAPVRYVPFTYEHVPKLNLSARRVTVRLPEG